MNPTNDNRPNINRPNIDEHLFDLLVDGELSEAQRRELLAKLDDVPGGWRRCAMSFLEAQSWKQELRSLVPPPTRASAKARPTAYRLIGRGWTVLAMAASFLIAIWLGTLLKDALRPGGPRPTHIAGTPQPTKEPISPDTQPPATPQHPDMPASPWQTVTLAVDGGSDGAARSIQLPAIERRNLAEAGLQDMPVAMPPEILKALKYSGHQVRQSRQLLPLLMRDGRRLVVPVDQFDVNYVGNPAYQ